LKKIGVVEHPKKQEAAAALAELEQLAPGMGFEIVEPTGERADIIVALGGDGTILRAAAIAIEIGCPLLGVNVGRLGYLATIGPSQLAWALEAIASNRLSIEERMTLTARIDGATGIPDLIALNEIAVEKASPPRVIDVAVSVDSGEFATFTADGFLVATPTGSTAYSLSAGGPIVDPSLEAIILTPVSAHAPLWRSIVVAPDRVISMKAIRGDAVLTFDGQSQDIPQGATVVVRKNERSLKLVRLEDYDFFGRVRKRFNIEPNA